VHDILRWALFSFGVVNLDDRPVFGDREEGDRLAGEVFKRPPDMGEACFLERSALSIAEVSRAPGRGRFHVSTFPEDGILTRGWDDPPDERPMLSLNEKEPELCPSEALELI
jgi:hypothetical protein